MNWYQKSPSVVQTELKVDFERGLSGSEVESRLKEHGPNILAREKRESYLSIFVRQFKSPLIYILIVAGAVVLALRDYVDAAAIFLVLITNSVVGAVQEGRARNSLEKLRALTRHRSLVRRGGEEVLVSADELVPGDIIILKVGDRVGADARIIKEESFKVDEAILTGEAYSVEKNEREIGRVNLVVGDQKNMVFAGTGVVSGWCEAVVVATGFDSELGKISQELAQTANLPLPLAKKLSSLSHFIGVSVAIVASLVFVVGLLRGIPFLEIFSATVGIVVSLVPEGLPVAVTIVLAHGVWRMARAKAIVRQMAAVEAMGSADTLLVDKTGTITTGRMVIREVYFGDEKFEVTGDGYDPGGNVSGQSAGAKERLRKQLELVYLSLTADTIHDEDGGWKPSGDPTEVAIAVLCRKMGLVREKLEKGYKTVFANPFDGDKRYIEASFEKQGKKHHVFVGAPDFLSRELHVDHGFLKQYHGLAKAGLRVVGVAIFDGRKVSSWSLLAIDEEIRPSVRQSITEAKDIGFDVVMLTGDYPETAKEIARKVGIFAEDREVLTGVDVEKLTESELSGKVGKISVFARITPEHKLKIVKAFQAAGRICAMTGDGVNDAPALQAANLGIGLGSGTQVAKDSSDIILVNNNFETIIEAIGQGRAIYFSLKRVILYLFATSVGEVAVLAGAVFIGLPIPLLAVQIIWLNFITDGFFVVALAQDTETEKGLVSVKEVDTDNLVDKLMIVRGILMGGAMLVCTMPIFYYFLKNYPLDYVRSVTLLTLAVSQWFNAFNVRSRGKSIFFLRPSGWLLAAVGIVFVLQVFALGTDLGNKLLGTQNLSLNHWILAFAASTVVIWVEEARKIISKVSKVSRVSNVSKGEELAPLKSGA